MKRFQIVIAALAFAGASSLTSCSTPKGVRATAATIAESHAVAAIEKPQFPVKAAITLKDVDNPALPTYKADQINPGQSNTLRTKFAAILKVAPQMVTNNSLFAFIDSWMGTPYRFGGTTRKGIDCSAFVRELYAHVFGTSLVRTAVEQFGMARRIFSRQGGNDSLREGDLVFFRTVSSRISHVGVYLTNNHFVHSCSSKGVTVSSLDETYWARTYAGAGRIL